MLLLVWSSCLPPPYRGGHPGGEKGESYVAAEQQTSADATKAWILPGFCSQCRGLLEGARPRVNFLARLVLSVAVSVLEYALELLALAVDLGNIVVGKVGPLRLHLTGELLPIAFNPILIHGAHP